MNLEYKSTIHDRIGELYENDEFCDIEFHLCQENTIEKVKGHRLIFAVASPVFKAMMFGSLAEGNSITIEDTGPQAFSTLKKYLYTDDIKFESVIHAMAVFEAADKYDLPHLLKVAEEYIRSNVTPENALEILPFSIVYNNHEMEDVCMNLIESQTEEVLNSERFVDCRLDTLELIVAKKNLNTSEINLFDSIEKWVKNYSIKQKTSMKELPELLSPIVEKIRFLCMTPEEFVDGPSKSELLTQSEKLKLLKYIVQPGSTNISARFCKSTTQRSPSIYSKEKCRLSVNWTLEDVSKMNAPQVHQSNSFYLSDMAWKILFCIHNVCEEEYVSLKLTSLRENIIYQKRPVEIITTFKLVAQKRGCQDKIVGGDKPFKFVFPGNTFGFEKFIKWSDVLDPTRGFLKNDKIKVEVELLRE